MDEREIIYQQKTETTKIRLLKSLSISAGAVLIAFLSNYNLTIVLLVGIGSFVFQLFYGSKKYFDGIQIKKDSLKLQRQPFFKEFETHEFEHSNIEKILYSESKHRNPRYIIITLKELGKEYQVYITSNIFKFAYGLRALKLNGVKIELEYGDHEIELFLDGKIPDVPMTNDMQITSDKKK